GPGLLPWATTPDCPPAAVLYWVFPALAAFGDFSRAMIPAAIIEAASIQSVVRRARVTDAGAIQRLITTFADRDEMLHRSLGEIYENIRDFYVAEDETAEIVACGGLHVCWSHLAEVKSLAVEEGRQGRGYGRR